MASQSGKTNLVCPYCGAPGFKKSKLRAHVEALHSEHVKAFKDLLKAMR